MNGRLSVRTNVPGECCLMAGKRPTAERNDHFDDTFDTKGKTQPEAPEAIVRDEPIK